MLKRQFIVQDIYSKEYATKNKEGIIVFHTEDILISLRNAHLFDTKTEIYEYIKSTNKELIKTGNIRYFKIDEVIS